MCLATKMSPKKKAEFKEQTEGWKVLFKTSNGKLEGDCYFTSKVRPEGEWLNEKDYRSTCSAPSYINNKNYPFGWHIFLTLKGAEEWRRSDSQYPIRKVQFKKPVAYGWQGNIPIVVAKEMMIPKEAQ